MDRGNFISTLSTTALALPAWARSGRDPSAGKKNGISDRFTLSLSQWAYRQAILGDSRDNYEWFIKTLNTDPDGVLKGDMDPRDIVIRAREHGVGVVDLVNILWFGHGQDKPWLREFKRRADGEGVGFGVLMCDQLKHIGSSDRATRKQAVENHIRWMETGAELGCRYLRANPYGDGTYLQQCRQSAESLHQLGEASKDFGLEVLVENHGHPGSTGAWLAMLIEMTDHPQVGVFTDFDNFFMGGWNLVPERRYDRLQGMLDLAPYTRAVSAKAHAFDAAGKETTIDFAQCMKTLINAGFSGLISAEYEGDMLPAADGTRATIDLLTKVLKELG
jgi:sugar phosphate isomerase/epimerase